jgi:hypothetical protein
MYMKYAWFYTLLMHIILSGCTKHVNFYSGPKLPDNNVARISGVRFRIYEQTEVYRKNPNPKPYLPPNELVSRTTKMYCEYKEPLHSLKTLNIDGKQLVPDPNGERVGSVGLLPGSYNLKWSKEDRAGKWDGSGILNVEECKSYLIVTAAVVGKITKFKELYGVIGNATWIEMEKPGEENDIVLGSKPSWWQFNSKR